MSETTRVFGTGGTVQYAGKTYTYGPITLDMLAMFSARLEDQAWRKVERQRGTIPEAVYADRLDAVARLVTANAFDYDGALAEQASRSTEGRRYLWFLMLSSGKNEEPVDEVLAGAIYDADPAAISARMRAVNADPTAGAAS